ncbi:hypothetical protein [Haloarcula halophila]|uniref:hypothetical protein n=1 Tax=Haloarcula TaxID=2237 RepID=UPI0023E39D24|nr:hypothetical protein [Halomicroarcula sp. DFY41]
MTDTERLPYAGMAVRYRFRLSALHRLFAVAVVVLYGIGDTATTALVLASGGVESAAIATAAIDQVGLIGLVGLKLLALSFAAVAWLFLGHVGERLRIDATPFQVGLLAILVVRGAWLTLWNLTVLAELHGIGVTAPVPYPGVVA